MANKTGRSLNDNEVSNVSGGTIHQIEDKRFKVVDEKTGKNAFNDKIYFDSLDAAVSAAREAGVSTEATTLYDHKVGKAIQSINSED